MKYCIETVSPVLKVECLRKGDLRQGLENIMRGEMCWFQRGKFYVHPEGDFEHGQIFDVDELRKSMKL